PLISGREGGGFFSGLPRTSGYSSFAKEEKF
ncbi:hypothetical protein M2480_003201, partial [Parabacteroides sp. PFB2-12]|nr:hypothetical protein [Parabacteroides sp. PFB2-12]